MLKDTRTCVHAHSAAQTEKWKLHVALIFVSVNFKDFKETKVLSTCCFLKSFVCF